MRVAQGRQVPLLGVGVYEVDDFLLFVHPELAIDGFRAAAHRAGGKVKMLRRANEH